VGILPPVNIRQSLLQHLSIAALLCLLLPTIASGQPIRFAPLPLEDPKIIHEQIGGLIDFLAEYARLPITWINFRDYGDLIAAFRNGEVDLAYLGPLPLAILQRDYNDALPLGCFRDADGAPHYSCSLVAFGDDNLFPSEIQGKHIGLTQPYSTCGWLAVSEMLRADSRRLDGDGNRFTYAGSHSQAALGVVRGRFDVAGVKTAIARRYAHLHLEQIAESQRWPGFSLVANTGTLSAEQITQLREALAELEDLEHKPALLQVTATWGKQVRNGIVAPAQCDYSAVADALAQLPWPIPGAPIAQQQRLDQRLDQHLDQRLDQPKPATQMSVNASTNPPTALSTPLEPPSDPLPAEALQ